MRLRIFHNKYYINIIMSESKEVQLVQQQNKDEIKMYLNPKVLI